MINPLVAVMPGMELGMGRRCKLPVAKPDTGDVSLWSLLCKNIGKDLSKICMPVTLNEPLSMLQVGKCAVILAFIFCTSKQIYHCKTDSEEAFWRKQLV